jgi:hypothetical protein
MNVILQNVSVLYLPEDIVGSMILRDCFERKFGRMKKILSMLMAFSLAVSLLGMTALAETPSDTGSSEAEASDTKAETGTTVCDHTYQETSRVEPTCTEAGSVTSTCTKCGDVKTETLPAKGHTPKTDSAVVTAPTCTEDGYTTYTCAVCGAVYTGDVVKTSGHQWSEWSVKKEATDFTAGSKTRTCSVCKAEETETIAAKYAARIGETGFATFDAALRASQSGDTIEVLSDITESGNYKLDGKSVTVSLSGNLTLSGTGTGLQLLNNAALNVTSSTGKTMSLHGYNNGIVNGSGSSDESANAVTVSGNAVLSVTGSAKDGIFSTVGLTLNIAKGASLISSDNGSNFNGSGIYQVNKRLTANIQGTLTCERNAFDNVYIYYCPGEGMDARLTMVVDGGTVNLNCAEQNGIVGNDKDSSKYDFIKIINGGTFNCDENKSKGSIYISFDIENGSLHANGNKYGMLWTKITAVSGTVTANNNAMVGISFARGSSRFDAASTLIASGNSFGRLMTKTVWCGGALIVPFTQTSLNIENGANVEVKYNACSGLLVYGGSVTMNSGVISGNGCLNAKYGTDFGGGVYCCNVNGENPTSFTMGGSAKVYNNHARDKGDDIYCAAGSTVTLRNEGADQLTLSDCSHKITGWFNDGLKDGQSASRWNVSGCVNGREQYIDEFTASTNGGTELAVKAAHAVIPVVVPVDPTPTPIPEEPTPLTPNPTEPTVIPEPVTPTTDLPNTKTPTAEIPSARVPKASVPKTGDSNMLFLSSVCAAASLLGITVLSLHGKRKKEM